VSLCIYTDDSLDSNIKELYDTVDYTKVYEVVKEIMEQQQFQLLEACANTIIENVFKKFDLIIGLKVVIEKPGVPLNAALNYVAVEMERYKTSSGDFQSPFSV